MRRWASVFRRHQWHKVFNHETKKTWLECRRCGRRKIALGDMGSNPNALPDSGSMHGGGGFSVPMARADKGYPGLKPTPHAGPPTRS
jgi:hypothetical protein